MIGWWWTAFACLGEVVVSGEVPLEPVPGLTTERVRVAQGESFTFTLPPGTGSALVVAGLTEEERPEDPVVLASIDEGVEPFVGRVLGADRDQVQVRLPIHVGFADVPIAGDWAMTFAGSGSSPLDVVLQHRPVLEDVGVVHVQVVLTAPIARNAEARAILDESLDLLVEIWSDYGIELQPYVQETTAPGRCPDPDDPRAADIYLPITQAGTDADATVVVCRRIGLPNVNGVNFGGAIAPSVYGATLVEYLDNPFWMSRLISHELGHAGGLRHLDDDDLEDTTPCDDLSSCRDAMPGNLMLPGGSSRCNPDADEGCIQRDELTPQQLAILRSWVGVLPRNGVE